jgi:hypothetical protein
MVAVTVQDRRNVCTETEYRLQSKQVGLGANIHYYCTKVFASDKTKLLRQTNYIFISLEIYLHMFRLMIKPSSGCMYELKRQDSEL